MLLFCKETLHKAMLSPNSKHLFMDGTFGLIKDCRYVNVLMTLDHNGKPVPLAYVLQTGGAAVDITPALIALRDAGYVPDEVSLDFSEAESN